MSKIFKRIDLFFKSYKANQCQRKNAEYQQEKNSKFYLDEVDGKVYIICDGIAIYMAESDETMNKLTEQLKKVREISINYGLAKKKHTKYV